MTLLRILALSIFICLSAQHARAVDIVEQTEAYVRDAKHTYEQKTAALQRCLDTAQAHIEIKQCLSLSVDVESDEMNRAYEEAEEKLRSVIEKAYEPYLVDMLLRLHTSQRVFDASLDAFCSFESVGSIGGTGESTDYMGCMADRTRDRAEDIKHYVLQGLPQE